jgi:hypothetical protein
MKESCMSNINKKIIAFMACFAGVVSLSTPLAFSQNSAISAESVDELTIRVDYFFGRPNPTLVIADKAEIQYILDEVSVIEEELVPCEKVFTDKKPWFNGISLLIQSKGEAQYITMSKGFKITKNKCSPKKNEKLMKYLVERVLDSGETRNQVSTDLKEKLKKAILELSD